MRTYGFDGTIHGTKHLDVEVNDGKVVAVWFRCAMLPFQQVDVGMDRVIEMRRTNERISAEWELHAVNIAKKGEV